ncbi:hypothetical protein R1flu_014978 [Riccia fluitans]|uniref:Uncharacterized protein n=1 Tax=Riccia fluitans TaxID=41844 RepID=A0ABD1YLD9_9MARC
MIVATTSVFVEEPYCRSRCYGQQGVEERRALHLSPGIFPDILAPTAGRSWVHSERGEAFLQLKLLQMISTSESELSLLVLFGSTKCQRPSTSYKLCIRQHQVTAIVREKM